MRAESDRELLTLTPTYDVCPQTRSRGEAAQVMAIGTDGFRMSQVAGCVERASTSDFVWDEAWTVVDRQIEVIETNWDEVCDIAGLARARALLSLAPAFLNRHALERY